MSDRTIKLSGVVVCFNEASRLGECLDAMRFCEDRTVIDLGSSDGSAAVAEAHGARVVDHPWVPVVERVRSFAAEQVAHDWLVFLDPDMVLPEGAEAALRAKLAGDDGSLACVGMAWQAMFIGRELRFTRWGGLRRNNPVLLHRRRMAITEEVHAGLRPLPGYRFEGIEPSIGLVIKHYWIDSLDELLSKHRRYNLQEGKKRIDGGKEPGPRPPRTRLAWAFVYSYLQRLGVLEGRLGLFLSVFWACYLYNNWAAARWIAEHQERGEIATTFPADRGIRDDALRTWFRRLGLPEQLPAEEASAC